jgi:hypothetical protein
MTHHTREAFEGGCCLCRKDFREDDIKYADREDEIYGVASPVWSCGVKTFEKFSASSRYAAVIAPALKYGKRR